MTTLTVLSCGPGVTIQDGGRWGWEHCGATTGGALDPGAWRLGAALIDNPGHEAAIEIPWGGASFRFADRRRVAITGGHAPLTRDGKPERAHCAFDVAPGSIVTLGRAEIGVWLYLHVEGGINVPSVLGSRSTVTREAMGGLDGRALTTGDVLPLGSHRQGQYFRAQGAGPRRRVVTSLRFLPGYQFPDFTETGRATLTNTPYEVTSHSNRMGMRLCGSRVETAIEQLWSEGTTLGDIQVPPDGQPIVLLNDRQTMGGYPRAGAVLSVDCARLVHLRPGDAVRFIPVSVTEADRILWLHRNYEHERVLQPLPVSSGFERQSP